MNETSASSREGSAAAYYRDVPEAQREGLRRFRAAHPCRRVRIRGVDWEYRVTGSGERPLLWLPGALIESDSVWPQAARFAETHRVIVPSYPPLPGMAEQVDGLAALLDTQEVSETAVVGGSYGGMVAQVLVRRHPARVRKLVLSHTLPPDRNRGGRARAAAPFHLLLPEKVVRRMYRRRMAGLIPAEREEAAWLRAYLDELVAERLGKDDIIALYRRVADYDTLEFDRDDLSGWAGAILLVLAEDDRATPRPVRDRLIELYPQAQLELYRGTGHAAALLRPEDYYRTIERFLDAS